MKGNVGIILVILILLFFLSCWILQILYNYSVPRIVESVSPTYDKNKFRKINYITSITIFLLCSMLFGSTIVVQKYI